MAHAGGLLLRPPMALYPQADPATTPAELGTGWLVLLESPTPAEPLAGDSGQLLDNMLRAMRLHRHPRCFVATLSQPQPGRPAEGEPPAAGLQQALTTLRPAMVLVLGLGAARGRGWRPRGRLRLCVWAAWRGGGRGGVAGGQCIAGGRGWACRRWRPDGDAHLLQHGALARVEVQAHSARLMTTASSRWPSAAG